MALKGLRVNAPSEDNAHEENLGSPGLIIKAFHYLEVKRRNGEVMLRNQQDSKNKNHQGE